MSFLASTRATLGPRLTFRPVPASLSALHTSPARFSLKESDTNRDDMSSVYEAEKEHQSKDRKEGKAHWKQELASNSEASVKADREETQTDAENMEKLQQRTKDSPRSAHGP
ncbi:uncharacterized protein EURHEDRAFT_411133 [Aspergillus ruber CBS 135680]|uniref:Uncharacterized protein n=1 Tax=Aspergillus ruber (strain CBS 135680) TaxID=1388766 RepID=A0A017SI45_ASPRC|nr:uncharacterized protein EURHEDRAFT_411133 [Aspergillus ruber CBS 135680]EYE96627.1 hypothetical protein EURHEDRAFT_411133 [Aspergillus ruber CBS 135680]